MKMELHRAILLERRELAPGLVALKARIQGMDEIKPGQFFEFQTGKTFLPRAISVSDCTKEDILFVVKVVGPGTSWISQLEPEALINIRGPLGQGAPIGSESPVMLCAGGVGAAPLLYLARKLKEKGIACYALIASRTANELILLDEFRSCCERVILATEDGSEGEKGLLTDVLLHLPELEETKVLYACGPEAMFVSLKALSLNQTTYAFLESRMGCGTGLCVGCAVLGRDNKYHRVCTEGPVFNLQEITFES
jgi:dihydroorotate dehydrogenase electron transfer subunit